MTRGFCALLIRLGLGCLLFATMVGTSHASINLVLNPGFETGDFTDWTQGGNTGFTGVGGGGVEHSGSFGAFFGPIGSLGFLTQSQDIATTIGNTYEVSFWLHNDGGTPNEFTAAFGGVTGVSQVNAPGFAYTNFTFDVVATAALSTLQFGFRQDPAFWFLDDVSVTDLGGPGAVPEASSLMVWGMLGFVGIATVAVRRSSSRWAI